MLAASIKPDHFPSKIVESTPQVVDSVAYYQGNAGWRLDGGESDVQFPIISVTDRRIEVLPSKRGKLPFQIADVMIGPFDL